MLHLEFFLHHMKSTFIGHIKTILNTYENSQWSFTYRKVSTSKKAICLSFLSFYKTCHKNCSFQHRCYTTAQMLQTPPLPTSTPKQIKSNTEQPDFNAAVWPQNLLPWTFKLSSLTQRTCLKQRQRLSLPDPKEGNTGWIAFPFKYNVGKKIYKNGFDILSDWCYTGC